MRRAIVPMIAGMVLTAAPAHADVQQWTELGVSKPLNKKLELKFDQHLRFDITKSQVEAIMPEPGIQYRLQKWLRLGAAYRLQYARDGDEVLTVRHRFQVYGKVRKDVGPVRIEYRLQLQEQIRPGKNDLYRHVVRNRLDVAYRGHKRWTPGVQAEAHHAIDDGDAIHLDKIWLTANLAYDRKQWTFDVFYRTELPISDDTAPTLHILGLGVHYEL